MADQFEDTDNLFLSDDQQPTEDVPDFSDLFEDTGGDELDSGEEAGGGVSGSDPPFTRLEKITEEPKPYFLNKNYYQEALSGEGEVSKRLHAQLASFLKAEDPEDRSAARGRLGPLYWELLRSISTKVHTELPVPKRLVLRFGVLLPTMIDKDMRRTIASIPEENTLGQPIHYVDEWLKKVARGEVYQSATDETSGQGPKEASKVTQQLQSVKGKINAQLDLIRGRNTEMEEAETTLKNLADQIAQRPERPEAEGMKGPYDESQRSLVSDISQILRRLGNMNREMARAFSDLEKYQDQLEDLESQADELGESAVQVDTKAAEDELGTVQQMAKVAVGRQGNHFPMLAQQYYRSGIHDMGTRENVNNVLAYAERLDPGVFLRTFKQHTNRIVPNVILVPCYGELGICWEPFERFNRATSRGRLAIPMYPKNIKTAVVASLGDLRWQVAKEKAAHYWMEEGLTGWYYQWFTEQKIKGDVKDQFVQDYVLWITKESEGTQKLSREVRDIFWRYMPFPQDVKDMLKNRGFVYQELYKKDENRARSDGY